MTQVPVTARRFATSQVAALVGAVIALAASGAGCTRDEGCADANIVCADELTITASVVGVDGLPVLRWSIATGDGTTLDTTKYTMKVSLESVYESLNFTTSSRAEVQVKHSRIDHQAKLAVADADKTRGTYQYVPLCVRESGEVMDCKVWEKERRETPIEILSESDAKKYGPSVKCEKLGYRFHNGYADFGWVARSGWSYRFRNEPTVMSDGYGLGGKKPYLNKGSWMDADFDPDIRNGKDIVSGEALTMHLPVRHFFNDLVPGTGETASVMRAGFSFGPYTVGCKIKQQVLYNIVTTALDGESIGDKTLHILFPTSDHSDLVGEHGWCYFLSAGDANPRFKEFDDSTSGEVCETL